MRTRVSFFMLIIVVIIMIINALLFIFCYYNLILIKINSHWNSICSLCVCMRAYACVCVDLISVQSTHLPVDRYKSVCVCLWIVVLRNKHKQRFEASKQNYLIDSKRAHSTHHTLSRVRIIWQIRNEMHSEKWQRWRPQRARTLYCQSPIEQ